MRRDDESSDETPVLNRAEQRMVSRALIGETTDLTLETERTVHADVIRRLLFGFPLRTAEGSEIAAATVVSFHLKGARIAGELRLAELTGPAGSHAPALTFEDCEIPDTIDLSHARLKKLSLRGSRITRLKAHWVGIDGTLDLSKISSCEEAGAETGRPAPARPPADAGEAPEPGRPEGLCQVELLGAHIAGDVTAGEARLCGPAVVDQDRTEVAFMVQGAHIGGRFKCEPHCRINGGFYFPAARIAGDVWARGIEIYAGSEYALNAQASVIEGHWIMRGWVPDPNSDAAGPASRRTSIYGPVWCLGVRIAGSLDLSGAFIGKGERKDEGLVLGNAHIGEHLLCSTFKAQGKGAQIAYLLEANVPIEANSMEVGGQVDFQSARIGNPESPNALKLVNAVLKKDADFSGVRALGHFHLNSARVSGDLQFNAVDFRNTQNGQSEHYSIHAAGLQVADNFSFAPIAAGGLSLNDARIDGSVALGDLKRETPQGSHPVFSHCRGTLDFSGARIGGAFRITNMRIEREGGQGSTVLTLLNATVGKDFFCNGSICAGVVRLASASFGGTVQFLAVDLKDEGGTYYSLDAPNIDVGENFSFIPISAGGLSLNDARIGGGVTLRGLTAREVGNTGSIRAECFGAIRLIGARIGNHLWIREMDLKSGKTSGFDASRCQVEGNVVFVPRVWYQVSFNSSSVGGDFVLGSTPANLAGAIEKNNVEYVLEQAGTAVISLADMKIRNTLKTFPLDVQTAPRDLLYSDAFHRRLLYFPQAKRSSFLISRSPLSFYPGWSLVRIARQKKHRTVVLSLLEEEQREGLTGQRVVALNTGALALQAMNDSRIRLRTKREARAYLGFFCENVWGAHDGSGPSPFSVIEDFRSIPGSAAAFRFKNLWRTAFPVKKGEGLENSSFPERVLHFIKLVRIFKWNRRFTPRVKRMKRDRFSIQALVHFQDGLFLSSFEVKPNGEVAMTDDVPLLVLEIPGRFKAPFVLPWRLPAGRWEECPVETVRQLVQNAREPVPAKVRIDLARTQVGVLDDENGDFWGSRVLLELRGFTYASIKRDNEKNQLGAIFSLAEDAASESRPESLIDSSIRTLKEFWNGLRSSHSPYLSRIQWLRKQYSLGVETSFEYYPQPYLQLIHTLRSQGQYEDADRITSEMQTIETRILKGFLGRKLFFLYRLVSDYGLSIQRAFACSLLFLGVGAACVWALNRNGFLVDDPLHVSVQGGSSGPVLAEQAVVPCGDSINSIVYALDIMIPLVDFRQEYRCHIGRLGPGRTGKVLLPGAAPSARISIIAAWLWDRYLVDVLLIGKALYTVLGWILTTLLVLTVSGFLRRRLES